MEKSTCTLAFVIVVALHCIFLMRGRLYTVVATFILSMVMYYAHRMLQLQYYHHCRSDLFRILFFHQSPICMHVTNILNIVETAGNQLVKYMMDRIVQNGLLLGGIGGEAAIAMLRNNNNNNNNHNNNNIRRRTYTESLWNTLFPQRDN